MDEKTFYERFVQELNNIAKIEGFGTDIHRAFLFWIGKNYLNLDDDEDIKNSISDGSNDEGMDAIFFDEIEHRIYVINAATVESFERTERNLPETDIKILLAGVDLITTGDYRGKVNPILEDLANHYHQLLNTGEYTVKILFCHLFKPPTDLKYIDEFKKKFSQVEVELIDFGKFKTFYDKYLVYQEPPPAKVPFEIIGDVYKNSDVKKTLIFSVSGKQLASNFITHGTSIFQRNLRYFLTNRSKSINSQITQTASDETESKFFWFYNNGITIVCEKIIEPPNARIIILEKMQIINGAQTTYSLAEAFSKNQLKDDVKVLLKVIESSEDTDFIDKVTLYTNSQNPVNLRDLSSRDTIQTRIQNVLRSSYRYFYERKRGELQALYPTDAIRQKEFGDDWENRVINNEKSAQAYMAFFLDSPSQAKSAKKRIFVKGATGFYDSIFSQTLLEEKLLMAYKLLKFIERKKIAYMERYESADQLPENERTEIYKYDFLLHSDFFILNLFKDFLVHKGYELNKDGSLAIMEMIDNNNVVLNEIYDQIKNFLEEYVTRRKIEDKTYYHTKFFKNDASIGLVRNFLKTEKSLDFIQLL